MTRLFCMPQHPSAPVRPAAAGPSGRRQWLQRVGGVGLGLLVWPGASALAQTSAPAAQPVRSAEADGLFIAVRRDNGSAVQRLLEQGIPPNVHDENGQTPLTLALQMGCLRAFDALMGSRHTNVEFRNVRDESPLMIAAIRGNLDAVTRLVRQGAHVNKPQWTPLHYAASGTSEQQRDITQLLLDRHAFIDAASPNGTTPLMMAAQYGTDAAAQLLMEAGADPLMKNQLGLTAADFARRAGRERLAEQIARYTAQVQQRRR